MSHNENQEISISTQTLETAFTRTEVEYSLMEQLLINLSKIPNLLKQGYTLVANYEKCKNFYLNFLKIIFVSELDSKIKKLAASTFKIFLTKNLSDDEYITNEERMVK